MTEEQYLLTIVMEECAETAQRASKAIRFTSEEIEPVDGETRTNAERLVYEFNDLIAVMELLASMGVINNMFDRDAIELKKAKIKKWMEYSKKRGTLSDKIKYY